MKRQKHNLSNYKLTTLNMGQLVPVQVQEVLPGDSMQLETSALVRCSPMLAPVMHPTTIRLHHWFVPNRVLWDGWEDFITGGPNNDNADTIPQITLTQEMIDTQLPDYMGIPPTVDLKVNALPFRAYNLIYNEFYRDQDLQTTLNTPDQVELMNIAWGKDYFTTARPWSQKGLDLTLPMGTSAPVIADDPDYQNMFLDINGLPAKMIKQTDQSLTGEALNAQSYYSPNLVADLADATGVTAIQFREFFALQRYAEARSQYGSRYTEYLRYLGVTPSDARLQRPEYLGGGKSNLQFSEVLTTYDNESTSTPAGSMKGHGISALRSRKTRKYFEEHGTVITLMSVLPKSIYQDGVQKNWLKLDKEDYFQKELQSIGQQTVLQGEIDASDPLTIEDTFGYTDRYNEYTWTPSQISGLFRTTLDFWHMGRKFETPPALNSDFIKCNPTKRIFAEQTQTPLWCMINNRVSARRMVKKQSIGRLM